MSRFLLYPNIRPWVWPWDSEVNTSTDPESLSRWICSSVRENWCVCWSGVVALDIWKYTCRNDDAFLNFPPTKLLKSKRINPKTDSWPWYIAHLVYNVYIGPIFSLAKLLSTEVFHEYFNNSGLQSISYLLLKKPIYNTWIAHGVSWYTWSGFCKPVFSKGYALSRQTY